MQDNKGKVTLTDNPQITQVEGFQFNSIRRVGREARIRTTDRIPGSTQLVYEQMEQGFTKTRVLELLILDEIMSRIKHDLQLPELPQPINKWYE
jgi:hypothetical protein